MTSNSFDIRALALAAVFSLCAGSTLWAQNVQPGTSGGQIRGWSGEVTTVMPAQSGIDAGNLVLGTYAAAPGWDADFSLDDNNQPDHLAIHLPSPFRESDGSDQLPRRLSFLPEYPHWYIYRFKYMELDSAIKAVLPFHYVEIDWNTERLPRVPNGSFVRPHFDFHFFVKSRDYVRTEMICVSNGKTCDEQRTGQAQMGRFLDFPDPCFLPEFYFPDLDSSIPEMGLHLLDGAFNFTEENVDRNPVILYGTFDGEIAFLEASLTLTAFENAIASANNGETLSWVIAQPERSAFEWWPKIMSLAYEPSSDTFVFSLTDFQKYEPADSCD